MQSEQPTVTVHVKMIETPETPETVTVHVKMIETPETPETVTVHVKMINYHEENEAPLRAFVNIRREDDGK
jgi:hypothetical protein